MSSTVIVFGVLVIETKISPDETLIPTRMEYVWRTTPDHLQVSERRSSILSGTKLTAIPV